MFRRGGDPDMVACTGILSTAKGCIMLPCNRCFVSSEIHTECIREVKPELGLVFAKQTLRPVSDKKVSDEVEIACEVYISAESRCKVRHYGLLWKACVELQPYRT